MNRIQGLFAILALTIPAGMAHAQTQTQSRPQMLTVTGGGENFAVEYGSAPSGNIVGGGAAVLQGGGQEEMIVYQDASYARRQSGIAMDPGGEGQLVYRPASASARAAGR